MSITLLTDPRDARPPWAPALMQEHLRRLGHQVEVRSYPDDESSVVHALGWYAGAALADSAWEGPWLLTPGTEEAPDAGTSAATRADGVLVTSSDHAAALNKLGVPNFRITVLPPAVDCETFTRLGPMANRTHRFRVVTRLSRDEEGMVRAVEALHYAPEAELIAVATRGGSTALPDAVERLALDTGVRARMAVVQAGDARERAWWLRSAHAALTLRDSGDPDLVVEAMACGTPVVATPVEAQRELVVHGITGFHVPAGRPRSAAGALREIFADEFRVEAFGMAASDRALSSLDWPHVVQGMDAAYRRLLGPAVAVDEAEAPAPEDASV
jgi:glycosyltransferase involved in cell wall biosynthesis